MKGKIRDCFGNCSYDIKVWHNRNMSNLKRWHEKNMNALRSWHEKNMNRLHNCGGRSKYY
jgi:hypothetical protein